MVLTTIVLFSLDDALALQKNFLLLLGTYYAALPSLIGSRIGLSMLLTLTQSSTCSLKPRESQVEVNCFNKSSPNDPRCIFKRFFSSRANEILACIFTAHLKIEIFAFIFWAYTFVLFPGGKCYCFIFFEAFCFCNGNVVSLFRSEIPFCVETY